VRDRISMAKKQALQIADLMKQCNSTKAYSLPSYFSLPVSSPTI